MCVEICKNIPSKKSLNGSFLSFRGEAIIWQKENMQVLTETSLVQSYLSSLYWWWCKKGGKKKIRGNNKKIILNSEKCGIWECVC